MHQVFLILAVVGGTLLLCQVVLALLGIGGHALVDGHVDGNDGHVEPGHHNGSWTSGLLTLKGLSTGAALFGLGGMFGESRGLPLAGTVLLAGGMGGAGMLLWAGLLRVLVRLQHDGTASLANSVGATGTVYVNIPAHRSGAGKVLVEQQNRTVEYQAVTFDQALSTGTRIRVVDVVAPDTVEVVADQGDISRSQNNA